MSRQRSDPTSGLERVEVAVGTAATKDDVLPWTVVADHAHPTLIVNLPENTDLWVRVRLTNKGKSKTYIIIFTYIIVVYLYY